MDKVIKCILLDVDNVIITEMLQVDAEIGDPDCKLLNPYFSKNFDNDSLFTDVSDIFSNTIFVSISFFRVTSFLDIVIFAILFSIASLLLFCLILLKLFNIFSKLPNSFTSN